MFNQIACTMDVYTIDELKKDGIIDSSKLKQTVKEYQKVIAVGPSVKNIEVGDLVKINPTRYGRKKYEEGSLKDNVVANNLVEQFNFRYITIDHRKYLLLYDTDVDYVVEEWEDEELPQTDIIIPNNEIIC